MAGTVHFLATELARWDALGAAARAADAPPLPEALVLGFFVDERPLRGAAGLCDWRLCGRLSRLLGSDKLTGKADEVVLMPPAGARLPFARLMLFGLGGQDGFGEGRYQASVARMRATLERAGVRAYAVQPPGRSAGLIAPRRALEAWLEVTRADGLAHDVTIVESPAGQKEMAEALRKKAS